MTAAASTTAFGVLDRNKVLRLAASFQHPCFLQSTRKIYTQRAVYCFAKYCRHIYISVRELGLCSAREGGAASTAAGSPRRSLLGTLGLGLADLSGNRGHRLSRHGGGGGGRRHGRGRRSDLPDSVDAISEALQLLLLALLRRLLA